MMIDDTGTAPKWWQWTLFGVGAALVVTAAVVLTVGSGGAEAGLIGAVAVGAAKGALIGAAVGSAVGIAGGAIHSASTGADMGDSILQGFLIGFGGGAIVGAVIGGFGGYTGYMPTKITGFTKHGINNAISKNGFGVSERAMVDAVKNSTKIIPQASRTKFKFVGKDAVVVLNKTGKVITTWSKYKVGRRIGGVLLWLGLNSLYEN